MAREMMETDTIGIDATVPGQIRFFIRGIPGSLPSLTDVPDGYTLVVSNGEVEWVENLSSTDDVARQDLAELAVDVENVETTVQDHETRLTAVQTASGTHGTNISNLTTLYNNLRKLPAGGSAGQALVIDANGTTLVWGTVASGGGGGTQGTTIYNGTAAPQNTLGANGDYYLNTTTSDYYYKESGSWVIRVNFKGIKGDTGTAGSDIITGSTVPASGTGKNGDLYIHTTTYDVYQKAAGAWTVKTNIKGGPGNTGAKGNTGASWSFNGNGDSYFQTPAATVLQQPVVRNGATVVFHYASDGVTFSGSAATFPLTMAANSVLRARASSVNTWASAAAVGT